MANLKYGIAWTYLDRDCTGVMGEYDSYEEAWADVSAMKEVATNRNFWVEVRFIEDATV